MTKPEPWSTALVRWFLAHKREMPWRSQRTPYRVWISEIMLQQTQVTTATPFFTRFMSTFPTVAALAAADQQEVLKAWEGLGYYSRARNLHAAAKQISGPLRGCFPRNAAAWRELPGVGPYTAAAIASICFGEPAPVVDGNVLRAMARFRGLEEDVMKGATRTAMAAWLQPHIERQDPSNFNEALMELGALVCSPRTPQCSICPLQRNCVALRDDRVAELPIKERRAKVPHIDVAVGLVTDSRGRMLLHCRPNDGMLAGMWELPGGKRQGREPLAITLAREAARKTGVRLDVRASLGQVEHAFSHFRMTLHVFACTRTGGRVHAPARWVTRAVLDDLPLPTANRKALALRP